MIAAMHRRKRRKPIVFHLLAVVLLVGAAILIIPLFLRSDFRTSLAKQLNVKPEFLYLNIPPAPNRLPGAAFVIRGPILSLVASLARDQLSQGATFEMEWRELGRNDAQSHLSAGPWSGLFSAETNDVFRVRLRDCRILEALPERIRDQLIQSEDVRRQANAGYNPLVIIRSYEGQMELKIERGSKSNAALWATKMKLVQDADGATSNGKLKVAAADDQQLVVAWTEPVVFAYEAAEARLFADHLGGTPDKVELTPGRESAVMIQAAASTDFSPPPQDAASKKKTKVGAGWNRLRILSASSNPSAGVERRQ